MRGEDDISQRASDAHVAEYGGDILRHTTSQ